jgi:hypothetical protein
MSARSPSICRCWVLAAALVVATGGVASVGRTQQLTGSIGASITILQPIAGQPVRVTGFSVDRKGVARLETTMPTSARTSQLVMTRVSSSTMDIAREPLASTLVPSDTASRMRLLVNVGRAPEDADQRRLELRIQYLTIAGT